MTTDISTRRSSWGFAPAQPEPWRDDAICNQTDPESFFPEKGGTTRPAKQICLGCPVRARQLGGTGECLDYALEHDERFGIWGGYSERERRRLLRGIDITPSPGTGYRLIEHGTHNCYRNGCRRTECCEANSEYQRDWKNSKKQPA